VFRIRSKGCKGWQTVAGLLNTLHDEATITIKPEGVEFKVTDLSHIGLIDFNWKKENFSLYECKEEQKIGIGVGEFKLILDRANNEDIELIHMEGASKIDVIIGTTKKYDLPLVNTQDTPKINVQYDQSNIIPLADFQNALEDVKIIDDHIDLTIDKGKLEIMAKGKWTRNNGTTVLLDEKIEMKEKASGRFQIDFLLNVIKNVKSVTKEFSASLANNKPFKFTFDIKGMGKLDYYIAPIQDI